MATDWPLHGQFNRHVQRLAVCSCHEFFTPDMTVPWVFLWKGTVPQSDPRMEFMEQDHWLTPYTPGTSCRWIHSHYNPDTDLVEGITLIVQTSPDESEAFMQWRVGLSQEFFFWEYAQQSDTTISAPDTWNRGQGWFATQPTWSKIIDTAVPDVGPPNGTGLLLPHDCIPGWKWGDGIPDP